MKKWHVQIRLCYFVLIFVLITFDNNRTKHSKIKFNIDLLIHTYTLTYSFTHTLNDFPSLFFSIQHIGFKSKRPLNHNGPFPKRPQS